MSRKLYICVIALLMPMLMGAQTLKGSYFLDNSLNRNKLNPAFAPRGSYFQMPLAGNFGAGVLTNLNLQDFLYPIDGQLYTFLNSNVTSDQFDAALAKNPHIDAVADVNLINFGWRRGKGFWTFDVDIKANVDVDLPRDLFTFLKKGSMSAGVYDIGAAKASAAASIRAALGYSRELFPGFRIGAKVRGILPAAYAGVNLYDVSLATSPEKWTVNANMAAQTSMHGLELLDSEGNLAPGFPDGIKILPAGWGVSADLGAEYTLKFKGFINGLSFSASILDLGFIKYSSKATRNYVSEGQMDWTGVKISMVDGAVDQEAINATFDELGQQFENLLDFKKSGQKSGNVKSSTLPSFYAGVEMPFCRNMMSIGALYSARKSWFSMRHELTLSYNLNPAKWLALGVNYSFLNTTKTLGLMMEFTPKAGPCLYFGVDYIPLEFAKAHEGMAIGGFEIPYVPTALRVNACVGLSFSLGEGKRK